MKYFSAAFLLLILFNSCKKEEKISDNKVLQDSIAMVSKTDSALFENKNIAIEPLNIEVTKGKTMFSENNQVKFFFDSRSNIGEIKINGKSYVLNLMNFVDNEYYISGDNVKISATDGNFQEMTGDCLYGKFPEVKVELEGKELILKNVSVQDCPAY